MDPCNLSIICRKFQSYLKFSSMNFDQNFIFIQWQQFFFCVQIHMLIVLRNLAKTTIHIICDVFLHLKNNYFYFWRHYYIQLRGTHWAHGLEYNAEIQLQNCELTEKSKHPVGRQTRLLQAAGTTGMPNYLWL